MTLSWVLFIVLMAFGCGVLNYYAGTDDRWKEYVDGLHDNDEGVKK